MTRRSLENAAAVVAATGGSTNAALHLPAIDLGMLVDRLETGLLRGPVAGRGFAPFYAAAAQKENADAAESLLRELESLYTPMTEQHGETPFAARLAAHIALAESLAATPDETGPQTLWRGEDGEQAALFLASLREHADDLPPVSALHYREIFCRLMAATSVRPAWGTHPRLAILGLLEARLNQADITIDPQDA